MILPKHSSNCRGSHRQRYNDLHFSYVDVTLNKPSSFSFSSPSYSFNPPRVDGFILYLSAVLDSISHWDIVATNVTAEKQQGGWTSQRLYYDSFRVPSRSVLGFRVPLTRSECDDFGTAKSKLFPLPVLVNTKATNSDYSNAHR